MVSGKCFSSLCFLWIHRAFGTHYLLSAHSHCDCPCIWGNAKLISLASSNCKWNSFLGRFGEKTKVWERWQKWWVWRCPNLYQFSIGFPWFLFHCMEQTVRMVWGKPQKSFLDRGLLCRIVQEDSESHVCFWLTAVAPWSLKEPLVSKVRGVHQILCEVHPVLFAFRLIGC